MAAEAQGFINFVVFLAKGDACEEMDTIVGEFQGDEDKVMLDFTGIYQTYSIELPEDWYPLKQGDVELSSSVICAAGAVLPLAKMLVHLSAWARLLSQTTSTTVALQKPCKRPEDMFSDCVMGLVASKEHGAGKYMLCLRRAAYGANITQQAIAAHFVAASQVKGAKLFLKLMEEAMADYRELLQTLQTFYDQFDGLVEFNAALETGAIDPKLTDRMCNCPAMQKCYLFLAHGTQMVLSLQKFFVSLAAAATPSGQDEGRSVPEFQQVAEAANANIKELKAFMPADSKVSIEELKASLSSAADLKVPFTIGLLQSAVANATIAQACCRTLKTGETRQALISRANTGIRKLGWSVHSVLARRCTAVLSGKPAQ